MPKILAFLLVLFCAIGLPAFPSDYEKKRVLITTDIGGGDPDDIQSMIHFLLYADMFDLEGIVVSRPRGKFEVMEQVIRAYAKDYKKLSFHSADYPTPKYIRSVVRVGAERNKQTPSQGYSFSTPGSKLIVKAAMKDDPRPLNIIVWGTITDVAQAIHDKPKIKKKIQVYSITSANNKGYNTEEDPSPSIYLRNKHKNLKWIEADTTFRGIYTPGLNDKSKYGNVGFVKKVIRNKGALGRLFYNASATIDVNKYGIKMGDTPSLLFLFNGDFDNPNKPSWGGRFCQVSKYKWEGCKDPKFKFGPHDGAKTVAVHRLKFLKDFEKRLLRLRPRN